MDGRRAGSFGARSIARPSTARTCPRPDRTRVRSRSARRDGARSKNVADASSTTITSKPLSAASRPVVSTHMSVAMPTSPQRLDVHVPQQPVEPVELNALDLFLSTPPARSGAGASDATTSCSNVPADDHSAGCSGGRERLDVTTTAARDHAAPVGEQRSVTREDDATLRRRKPSSSRRALRDRRLRDARHVAPRDLRIPLRQHPLQTDVWIAPVVLHVDQNESCTPRVDLELRPGHVPAGERLRRIDGRRSRFRIRAATLITDVHTHVGEYPLHISEKFAAEARAAWPDVPLGGSLDDHYTDALADVDRAVVLAFNAPQPASSSQRLRRRVRRARSRAADRLRRRRPAPTPRRSTSSSGCRATSASSAASSARSTRTSTRSAPSFLRVCEALERLELPMLIHQGTTFARAGSLLLARPILLDEIALRYPKLKIVIAHVGHPWFDEAIAVVRRHPHVYADISGARHPALAALPGARERDRVPRRAQAAVRHRLSRSSRRGRRSTACARSPATPSGPRCRSFDAAGGRGHHRRPTLELLQIAARLSTDDAGRRGRPASWVWCVSVYGNREVIVCGSR